MSFFGIETIGKFTKTGASTVSLENSNLLIGGKFIANTGILTLDTGVSGAGGIDVGVISTFNIYYLYAVRDIGDIPKLIISLSGSGPFGFLAFKEVGKMLIGGITDSTKPVKIGEVADLTASYNTSAATALTGAHATVKYLAKLKDDYNLYDIATGDYTVLVGGEYNGNCMNYCGIIETAAGQFLQTIIGINTVNSAQNQSRYEVNGTVGARQAGVSSPNLPVVKGDTLQGRCASDIGAARTTATQAWLQWFRVGQTFNYDELI